MAGPFASRPGLPDADLWSRRGRIGPPLSTQWGLSCGQTAAAGPAAPSQCREPAFSIWAVRAACVCVPAPLRWAGGGGLCLRMPDPRGSTVLCRACLEF